MQPFLTPLLLHWRVPITPDRQSFPSRLFAPFVHKIWGTYAVAIFSTCTLSDGDFLAWPTTLYIIRLIPVLAMLLIYLSFTNGASYFPLQINFEENIKPLSWRVLCILIMVLVIQTALFGFPKHPYLPLLAAQSLAKASSWFFLAYAAKHASWSIASAIGTFSMASTHNSSSYTSYAQAVTYILCSLLALGQTLHMLPRPLVSARSFLWLLGFVPVIPFIASNNIIWKHILAAETSFRLSSQARHPVEILAQKAKTQFEAMIHRQSQNYSAAFAEYRRRYGLDPPPGFQAWYAYAVEQQSPIVDEFDMLFEAIFPFLKVSGAQVQKAMEEAYAQPGSELWSCVFSPGEGKTTCQHPGRTFDRHTGQMFDEFLRNVRGLDGVGDVRFLINHLDEPLVLLSDNQSTQDRDTTALSFKSGLSHRPVWDILTQHCLSKNKRRRYQNDETIKAIDNYGIPFITSTQTAMDLCQNPRYSTQHGFFQSPASFRLFEGIVPILSTGSPSTMGDILYPSAAYMEDDFAYDEKYGTEWDKKKNLLYWAGSTTGAFATDHSSEQWQHFHRQRFVTFANNLHTCNHSYLSEHGNAINRTTTTFLNPRLYNVAFTQISHCARASCRAQSHFFSPSLPESPHAPLRHRLVFDLDGNGISGRFYRFLASHSCPLKQTLFREWHDERLVPWVHYVPVSMGMEELPELVQFLALTERGRELARRVAEEGREWFGKAMREVDRGIYAWRLVLELARVQDRGREAMGE
ncbi:uncharacterized protein EI97DRAFT_501158 [Westerdykella ornata]|uniref:Glycosyl transferase CAP10 domain-containing protein n=1 Tax=Westerdykella ornata TaxID=318751 RepID=A0A6A6JIA8_WESOR|nr:uncharacterized protein EI97DRAFT_501158 [Westerdykella ornata]KAF2276380.1 hypothetical protein EI97DRAFT_501158 [Westerdykella ornata]